MLYIDNQFKMLSCYTITFLMMVINFIPCSSSLESTNRQGTSWAASSTSSRLESSGTSSPSYAVWTYKTHVPGNLRYISTFLLTMKNYTLLSRIIRLTIMWGMLFSAICGTVPQESHVVLERGYQVWPFPLSPSPSCCVHFLGFQLHNAPYTELSHHGYHLLITSIS